MGLTLAIQRLFPATLDNDGLMTQYRLTQDSRYLEKLYDNCGNDLYHFLRTQADPELAQEIAQRTWVKVIEKRNQYRASGRFQSWLFTIARNLLFDEFRRQSRWVCSQESDWVDESPARPEPGTDKLCRALQALPFLQREALVLQLEGFGLLEIAKITQCDRETVKSRLRYGKDKLKQLMGESNV